ncbi:MAG: hypothetical protein Q7R97_05300 [Candidatus Daviesbacteria bacterium]|nr:hypothetical protein [Candidatus Daviesbacteria bacterium]
MATESINKQFDLIESEITSLKSMIINIAQQQNPKEILHLKGILKGISVTEEDIGGAKKSLFKAGM